MNVFVNAVGRGIFRLFLCNADVVLVSSVTVFVILIFVLKLVYYYSVGCIACGCLFYCVWIFCLVNDCLSGCFVDYLFWG